MSNWSTTRSTSPAQITVTVDGHPAGQATLAEVRRHVHRKAERAATDTTDPGPRVAASGIDYLRLVETRHKDTMPAQAITYAAITNTGGSDTTLTAAGGDTASGGDDTTSGWRGEYRHLQSHYGFTRMPFGRDVPTQSAAPPPRHRGNVARIDWCVHQRELGVITGEVGAGKTVASAALGHLEPSVTRSSTSPTRPSG